MQTIVPASGLGGNFLVAGNTDHLPAEIVRFERSGDTVAIVWQPSDATKPLSPAKHPMIFYVSTAIPEKYRPAISRALLAWNAAFEKIGISGALQVRPQPADQNFELDDIRYNVLRSVTEQRASFGADSQTLYDPRTGQEFRTGILISADVPLHAEREKEVSRRSRALRPRRARPKTRRRSHEPTSLPWGASACSPA